MTDYDTKGANFNEDEGNAIEADLPPNARIHVHHLAVIRLGKRALVDAIETGAVLQEERSRRGDGFEDWVKTQLGLTLSEADCYIRFYEESPIRPEQLSPAVEVKLPRVLELLGQLNNAHGKGATPTRPTGTTDRAYRSQPKPTVSTDVDNTPNQQAPKPKEAAGEPTKASDRAKKRTTKATAKAKPVQQDRDDRQSALTAEQEQLLMRRSPRLLARVCNGKVTLEEALRLAKDLPDRNVPQPS